MGRLMPITLMALAIVLGAPSAFAGGGKGGLNPDCPYTDLTREEKLAVLDVDGDGFLSPDEFAGPIWAFVRLDADADGLISFEEWMAHPCENSIAASGAEEPELLCKAQTQTRTRTRTRDCTQTRTKDRTRTRTRTRTRECQS
ncbi:MAG TPA: hypothetical protein VFH61_13355 [Thermoleophilia bacterium]|nr:hypothetical protein [Thermoleophilia bacterium]